MRLERSKRSKLAFFGAILFAAISFAADPPIVLRDFSPGLQTDQDSAAIADTASPDLLNVDVEDGSIRTRGGSVAVSTSAIGGYSSSAVRFLYEYVEPDGDRWVISAASATIFKSNNGGQDNSVLTSTHGFTTSSEYCAVTAFGTMRLTDGTTNWMTFDGTSVLATTQAPHGLTCAFFGERVWTSTGSILRATNIDDVDDWSVTASSGDADSISQPIRFNDGQGITCLKPFKDRLLIFKDQSLDAYILQEDGISFNLVSVSNHIGTSHCNSVVEREGDIVFLGPDAFYKYEPGTAAYKGYAGTLSRISDLIGPTIRSIQQLDANSTFHTETGQSDFQSGTLAQMNATISAGDVVLSSWTATDDSTSDFNAFSSSSSVNVTGGRVYLSTNNTNVENNGFEDGSGTTATAWTATLLGVNRSATIKRSGSWAIELDGSALGISCTLGDMGPMAARAVDTSNNVLVSSITPIATYGASWTAHTLDLSSTVGRWIKLELIAQGAGGPRSDPFLSSGGTVTFYDYCDLSGYLYIDDVTGGRSTISSGTITGQTRDTAFSNPAWVAATPTYTENGHSITWQTQSSSDGASWDSAVSWTPGSAPGSASKRYIRHVVTLSTGGTTSGVSLPFVESVPLAARASTGTYQGTHFATAVGSFGTVDLIETLNSGQTAYAIYTDTDTSASFTDSTTWISSQTVTDGAVPTLTPSTYAFFRASATITAGSQNPTISELSIALTGGNQSPVWAEYHQGTVLTGISTASSSGNDSVILYDRNKAWTLYDHDFYCMKRLLSGAIIGGSNSNGKIIRFRDTSLESDDGSGINAYWRSKDFDFGSPVADKTMTRYYVTADYEANSDAVLSYGVNRGASTSATLDLDSTAGFYRKSIVPTVLTYQKGIQHYFKISNSDADDSFVIRAVGLKPRLETEP